MIRIALPNKGRLADGARELLERAGLEFDTRAERALQASLGGEFHALFVNARDIPEFVADGAADVGITGRDLVVETGRDVEVLLDLGFGRCRLVVAAREDSGINTLADVAAGSRVATVFPRLASSFFERCGSPMTIVPVSTLKTNGLVEIATILESTALLISRRTFLEEADNALRTQELEAALESVLRAQDKRYLMANVPRARLDEVKRILPGISGPTIVDVMDGDDFVAAHAVVDRHELYRVIAQLKSLGAEGILVTRIERLMP